MRVLVAGGTGYVGGAVVRVLRAEGHTVRALVRPGSPRPTWLGEVELVTGDVVAGTGLEEAARGAEAGINLVGVLRAPRGQSHDAVHVQGTRNLAAACLRAGVRRLLYVSAVGADADGATPYLRAKAAAEDALARSGLEAVVVRPSVVFGPGGPGPNMVQTLRDLVCRAPVVPMFGDGGFLLQPISTDNLAVGIARLLALPAAAGRTYEAGGPERLPYREVLRRIATAAGRRLRCLSVPVAPLRAMLPLLERLPGFPLSRDEFTMLLAGNVCDPTAFWQDTGVQPEAFTGR